MHSAHHQLGHGCLTAPSFLGWLQIAATTHQQQELPWRSHFFWPSHHGASSQAATEAAQHHPPDQGWWRWDLRCIGTGCQGCEPKQAAVPFWNGQPSTRTAGKGAGAGSRGRWGGCVAPGLNIFPGERTDADGCQRLGGVVSFCLKVHHGYV